MPVLLVTGPVGVGKTTVASAVSDRLRAADVPHAFVDVDELTRCYPAPPDDPFRNALAMRNLAAMWRNFQEAGARYLVLARVLESRAELAAYCAAVPGARITVVRLRAPVETLHERIARRAADSDPDWARRRSRQLAEEMDVTQVEDRLIETENRSVLEIADRILNDLDWVVPGA